MLRRSKYVILLLLLVTSNVFSQSIQNKSEKYDSNTRFTDRFSWVDKHAEAVHEINFAAGYSFASSSGFWGKIPEASLSIYTLRYNRKLLTYNTKHLLEYVVEVNLAANYTLADTQNFEASSFSGFGLAPLGFQLNINRTSTIQPFFNSSAGFMHFKKPFPDERGVQFNFTFELGGGLEIMVTQNVSFSLGYKYHHMSNAQTGQINPGVDSNVFYSGITIF